jgi:hypothetical protein
LAKQLVYQVKVGETPAFYDNCILSVERYCKRHGFDHIVQKETILRIVPIRSFRSVNALRLGYLPIFEKANAFGYLGEYDQVAVIDADIYIRDTALSVFDGFDAEFGAVMERRMPLTQTYLAKIRKYSDGQYALLKDVDWQWNEDGAAFYNMGMMVLGSGLRERLNGDSPLEFIRRPEFERFVNGEGHWKWSTDQTLLNYWIKKAGIAVKDLDWKWNALYGAMNIDLIKQAHFVHFFLSAKMDRGGAEIPELIKRL